MVRIEVGFEPHPFEKGLVEQTQEDIANRLHGHEFGRFKIVLTKPPPSHQIAFQFAGDGRAARRRSDCLVFTELVG